MSERMKKAKEIYYWDEFRSYIMEMEGFSPEDFQKLASNMQKLIINSRQKDPVAMFFEIIAESQKLWDKEAPFPFNGDWHHFLVPGVILSALRNNGYEIGDKDIHEGIRRGAQARISCGFTGICGGANSMGSVAAIIKKATPLHEENRQEIMRQVALVLEEIARLKRRCCKRSSYIALKETIKYLAANNYFLPEREILCPYSSQNDMCAREECPFWAAQ